MDLPMPRGPARQEAVEVSPGGGVEGSPFVDDGFRIGLGRQGMAEGPKVGSNSST